MSRNKKLNVTTPEHNDTNKILNAEQQTNNDTRIDTRKTNQTVMTMTGTINAELIGGCTHGDLVAENAHLLGQLMMLISNEKSLQLEKLTLQSEISKRDKTIEELKKENEELKREIKLLKNEIDKIKQDKAKLDALVQLNECNLLVNNNFKREYRTWFKLMKYAPVPNIGDFINSPPDDTNDPEEYKFWEYFKQKFPKTTDARFRDLYLFISNQRAICGAHIDISKMQRTDFNKAAKIVFDDYEINKNLYDDYREWLFSFPNIF